VADVGLSTADKVRSCNVGGEVGVAMFLIPDPRLQDPGHPVILLGGRIQGATGLLALAVGMLTVKAFWRVMCGQVEPTAELRLSPLDHISYREGSRAHQHRRQDNLASGIGLADGKSGAGLGSDASDGKSSRSLLELPVVSGPSGPLLAC
jgi:hypothetical protein